jgi:hypothetical protein
MDRKPRLAPCRPGVRPYSGLFRTLYLPPFQGATRGTVVPGVENQVENPGLEFGDLKKVTSGNFAPRRGWRAQPRVQPRELTNQRDAP